MLPGRLEKEKEKYRGAKNRNVLIGELNVHIVLLTEFAAIAPDGRRQTKILQLGGVEFVGQRLNINGDFGTVTPDPSIFGEPPPFDPRFACSSSMERSASLWQMSSCSSLAIRLQFFFLSFDQFAADSLQRLLCQLLVCDVSRRTNKAGKRAVLVNPRRSDIQHPSVHPIVPPKPIFLRRTLAAAPTHVCAPL